MPTRDTAPAGAPCWIDLFTNDVDAAHRFYTELFGWTVDVAEEFGGYATFHLDGVPVGGCMGNSDPEHPADFWSVYLQTDDIAATVAAAQAAGGQEILAPMPVGDLGQMAMLTDPSGAAVGLWQAGTFAGLGVLAEPGAPAWFELHTRGYDAVLPFYRDVFGWDLHTMSDAPEFRYTTFGEGEAGLAGIMDDTGHTPEGTPPHFAIYIAVTDADATAAKAKDLGGAVEMAPENTPYGRLAVLNDTTGSRISIMGENT
jgi:predicted enzyme related to lactoylglutathione lyase